MTPPSRNLRLSSAFFALVLALLSLPRAASAQSKHTDNPASTYPTRTFPLNNLSQANDANEVLTGLRLILDPGTKLYLIPSQNMIVVRGTPEDLALAEKLLVDLDKPKKTYRLTYTLTEMDGSKRLGVQHFVMVMVPGGRSTLKAGSKVPVVTGSFQTANPSTQTQVTYLDLGLNFDSTIDESANGLRLRSKVEQSSIADEKSGMGAEDPIVRQAVLEGVTFLLPGKPLLLGSVDVPGSTRRLEIEAVLDPLK